VFWFALLISFNSVFLNHISLQAALDAGQKLINQGCEQSDTYADLYIVPAVLPN
jgi:hypothetical protein